MLFNGIILENWLVKEESKLLKHWCGISSSNSSSSCMLKTTVQVCIKVVVLILERTSDN